VAGSSPSGPDPLLGALALALDSTVTLIRHFHPNAQPGEATPIYLREEILAQDGQRVAGRRLPHRWLDSVVATLKLSGVCVEKDFACNRPFTGYLLTLWEPAGTADVVTIRLDVQMVSVERPMLQTFPTYGTQSPTTPPPDRLRMRVMSGVEVWTAASQDSTGVWRVTRLVAPPL
jgi:hypothetical protein